MPMLGYHNGDRKDQLGPTTYVEIEIILAKSPHEKKLRKIAGIQVSQKILELKIVDLSERI